VAEPCPETEWGGGGAGKWPQGGGMHIWSWPCHKGKNHGVGSPAQRTRQAKVPHQRSAPPPYPAGNNTGSEKALADASSPELRYALK